MTTLKFKDLPVNATFRFASAVSAGYQGDRGLWRKVADRSYTNERPTAAEPAITYRIGKSDTLVVVVAPS